jgi:hypothetical protein
VVWLALTSAVGFSLFHVWNLIYKRVWKMRPQSEARSAAGEKELAGSCGRGPSI